MAVVENLVLAIGVELLGGGTLAAEHHIHGALACHVLDLASGELKVGGELQRDLGAQAWYHRFPDGAACLDGRTAKLNLVDEAALEGLVEVGGEVRRGNHDAVQALHFLQDDVLDGVLHLIDGTLGSFLADA